MSKDNSEQEALDWLRKAFPSVKQFTLRDYAEREKSR